MSGGIREHTANASLIKLNQIGTVTETIEAVISKAARRHAVNVLPNTTGFWK